METLKIINGGNSTFVNENNPTSKFHGESYLRIGDASTEHAKTNYIYLDPRSDASLSREITLQQEGVPSGAVIEAVRIGLYLSSLTWTGQTTATMNVRPITKGFEAADLTWANRDTNAPVGTIITSFTRNRTDGEGWQIYEDADLTAYIQGVLDDELPLYGFRLSGVDISPDGDRNAHNYVSPFAVASLEPYIEIDYTPDTIPTCTIAAATSVDHESATLNGEVTGDGDSTLTDVWFERSLSSAFTSPTLHAVLATVAVKTEAITGLLENTTYYYRLHAENAVGVGTSPTLSFTTKRITATTGSGGAGETSSFTGTSIEYGGGGAGSSVGVADTYGTPTGAGADNTGTGGGGGAAGAVGSDGGSGIVVVRYKTEDAISAAFVTSSNTFAPGLAFQRGRLFAPYYDMARENEIDIASIGTGAIPTVTSTDALTNLASGMVVTISGSATTPSVDGSWVAGSVNPTTKTFTLTRLPATVTGEDATSSATARYNQYVGVQRTSDNIRERGWLTTSRSAMEQLTVLKMFKYLTVTHEPFTAPGDASSEYIAASWEIDGVETTGTAIQKSTTETTFPVHTSGYAVAATIALNANAAGTVSPKVHAIHMVWDYMNDTVHQYSLLCVRGAGSGQWGENPERAVRFLFSNASDLLEFEDRFAGTYNGTIDAIEFNQAQQSLADEVGGVVTIAVVEDGSGVT